MLHHVVNEHKWGLGECDHSRLTEDRDKEWLEPDSAPHRRLRKLMMDTRFLNNVKRYVNFR